MKPTVDRISEFEGRVVELKGWLAGKRSSGKIHFLQVRDGTGTIQCVMEKSDVPEDQFQAADHCPQESTVRVRGHVRKDARSPIGYELGVEEFEVLAEARDYPITPKSHGVGFLMEHRHLWLRSRRQHAIIRVRGALVRAIRDYLDSHGFLLVDTPILTPAACEGTTTLFKVDYFGEEAYLSQSGQLYNEAAAAAFGRVYCFGPTFRAEKSKTRRHLTEFWMVEPEMAFCDMDEAIEIAEDFLVNVVQQTLEQRGRELRSLGRDLGPLKEVQKPFPRISYTEAVELLRKKGSDIEWGQDFGNDDETLLTLQFKRPLVVHRFPTQTKAFYMKKDPHNPQVCLGFDILAPEGYGEIVGAGQREDDIQELERSIEVHGLPKEAFQWYLDVRRYGTFPHSGFGLGVERTVAWICGIHHVRETIPFPRMLEKVWP